MPRKIARQPAITPDPAAQEFPDKKWAEPYRPLVTNAEAGFELGENKLAHLMVFSFTADPGEPVKERLIYYGYFYDTRQKTWTVNATPVTREIARRLADEFAGQKAKSR